MAKTETKKAIKIRELFKAKRRAKTRTETKLANRAKRIECTSLRLVLIRVKKEIDRAIKVITITAIVPKAPTVARSSFNIPEALSKRTFQSGERLKFRLLNREKLEKKVDGPDPKNGSTFKLLLAISQEALRDKLTSAGRLRFKILKLPKTKRIIKSKNTAKGITRL